MWKHYKYFPVGFCQGYQLQTGLRTMWKQCATRGQGYAQDPGLFQDNPETILQEITETPRYTLDFCLRWLWDRIQVTSCVACTLSTYEDSGWSRFGAHVHVTVHPATKIKSGEKRTNTNKSKWDVCYQDFCAPKRNRRCKRYILIFKHTCKFYVGIMDYSSLRCLCGRGHHKPALCDHAGMYCVMLLIFGSWCGPDICLNSRVMIFRRIWWH
jgi:hypothetical protein